MAIFAEMFNKGLIITMGMLPIVVVLDQLACVAGDEQAVWIMKRPSREQFDAFDENKNGCVDWNEIETYFENVPEELSNLLEKTLVSIKTVFNKINNGNCVEWNQVEEYQGWPA